MSQSDRLRSSLEHLVNEFIDVLLTVAPVTTLDEGMAFNVESSLGCVELEGPQEVVGLLEVWTTVRYLMDQVFHAYYPMLPQMLLDLLVRLDRNPGTGLLHVSALVNQLRHHLHAWISVGDVGLDKFQHLGSGFAELHKDAIVELSESQQSQYFSGLGRDRVDTIIFW